MTVQFSFTCAAGSKLRWTRNDLDFDKTNPDKQTSNSYPCNYDKIGDFLGPSSAIFPAILVVH